MNLPWKRKRNKKVKLKYKFLCKHCDVFFERDNACYRKCPACHHEMELYDVIEIKDN